MDLCEWRATTIDAPFRALVASHVVTSPATIADRAVRPDPRRPTELSHRSAAFQAILGLVLVLVCWRISWSGPEPFRFHTFFPLWLGYILIVDALSLRISGS